MSLPPQPQHYQVHPHALGYPSLPFAIPVAPYPPTVLPAAPKRQMEQSDEESGSKSKKARSNARLAKSAETNGVPSQRSHVVSALLTVTLFSAQSRRGYSAKKRNEAAQIAAQNGACSSQQPTINILTALYLAQLMPTVSYVHVPNEKGKEKAPSHNRKASLFDMTRYTYPRLSSRSHENRG